MVETKRLTTESSRRGVAAADAGRAAVTQPTSRTSSRLARIDRDRPGVLHQVINASMGTERQIGARR
jgi:hypothetical protein